MVINRGTPSIVSTITNGTLVTENNSRDRTSNNDTEEIHEQQSTSGQIEEVDKRTHVDPPEIHQNNIWTYNKTPKQVMVDLLHLSENEDIEYILKTLYENEEMFYIYLHFCVSNVITKTKWKHNKIDNSYYNYITVSDEALTLLILDNNAKRYLQMSKDLGGNNVLQLNGQTHALIKPKYTLVNGSRKFRGKGWNRQGRMRYMELSVAIEEWRGKNERIMTKLAGWIMNRYTSTIMDGDTRDTRSDQMEQRRRDEEEEQKWRLFLQKTSRKRRRDDTMPPLQENMDNVRNDNDDTTMDMTIAM